MSMGREQVRLMAERIARRLSEQRSEGSGQQPEGSHQVDEELTAMRASLAELQQRLAHIESHITHDEEQAQTNRSEPVGIGRQSESASTPATRSPWLSGMYVPAAHPSQERFGIEEAAVSEMVDFFEKEKTCSLEPGGKPCDHCAMCSTRGF